MLVTLNDKCGEDLEKLKNEMIFQKQNAGEPERTTLSEVVCALIRYYRENGEGILITDTDTIPVFPEMKGISEVEI